MTNKYISDYIDIINEKYHFLERKIVYRIMRYSLFNIWYLNYNGGDVCIFPRNKFKYLFYMGKRTYDFEKHKLYWIRKMKTKIRILYNKRKREWDGYYYFALHDSQLARILKQKNKVGNPRKYFTFPNLVLYKIFEECLVREQNKRNIFRIPFATSFGYSTYKKDYRCKDFEYVYRRVDGGLLPINHNEESHNKLLNYNYCFLYWQTVTN